MQRKVMPDDLWLEHIITQGMPDDIILNIDLTDLIFIGRSYLESRNRSFFKDKLIKVLMNDEPVLIYCFIDIYGKSKKEIKKVLDRSIKRLFFEICSNYPNEYKPLSDYLNLKIIPLVFRFKNNLERLKTKL